MGFSLSSLESGRSRYEMDDQEGEEKMCWMNNPSVGAGYW